MITIQNQLKKQIFSVVFKSHEELVKDGALGIADTI